MQRDLGGLGTGTSERMRLGIFISTDAYGGAERYIGLLVDALRDQPIDVLAIGNLPRPQLPSAVARSIAVGPKWSRRTLIRSIFSARREKQAYLEVATSERLDGAHLQFKREQILLSKKLSAEMPVIWTEHGTLPKGAYGVVLRTLYKMAARHASVIICVSQAVVDDLRSCGVPAKKLRLAENPVNVEQFCPDPTARLAHRQELNLGRDEIAVLAMSRLDRNKGISRVIGAMHHLPQNYILLVAGAGSAEAELRQQAGPLSDRVRFLGFRNDPAGLLRAADVFCFPSTAASGEGVPTMAVLEAMATGLPVVATHDSGLANWLPPRGGLLAGDGESHLARSIVTAYEQRLMLSAAAVKTAQEHDLSRWRTDQGICFANVLMGSIPESKWPL